MEISCSSLVERDLEVDEADADENIGKVEAILISNF